MDSTVLDLPAPAATRLRRPGWRDPRLLTGLVLIAVSVALGSWVVTAAQQTVAVYVAAQTLTPGDAVAPAQLAVAEVRLAGAADGYLLADEPLPADAVVLRVVGEGELVPVAALGAAADLDVRAVAVPLGGEPPRGMVQGAAVDLWWTPAADLAASEAPPAPEQLAAALTVAEISSADGAFAAGGTRTVHVLVPVDDLPAVLAALGGDGTVDVVPVPGTGG
ncbi:hypothetical protein [Cellulomonas sp. SLBN-39]|uniref:hypothetical protein n=1 Tax=Cellulomonas sp. SLBN-39 TaxID=2768446 RepID=UPI00114EAE9A|nr:hypothetical protein [Cellulomonas sp. SLBN-39]TQL03720.1 hypothetical protein FBY24_2821 [Cellulomonas sp. SLBN-39]